MSKCILICDDDKDISEVTALVLESEGYDVTKIYSCDRIFEIIEEVHPDLILMDLRIPTRGGDVVTKELKAKDETKDIPVVIFSANHRAGQIAGEVGADGFISKPYEIHHLVDVVKEHLS